MKGRWWIIVAVAVAAYLSVMGCVMWPSQASAGKPAVPENTANEGPARPLEKLEGLPYRGVAMQVQRIDNVMDYGRSVDKVAELGADTILFVVDSKQENGKSTRIFLDMREEPSPEKLGTLIQYAHSKKLRVALMPIVLLEAPIGNEWRGTIHPDVWEDWWDSYREMLRFYSKVAESNHVELFVVGSELVSTENQLEEWTRTIRQVRGDYHGQITYSANWDHYTTIPFWSQLDLMGMNSYYKLGKNSEATVADIDKRWTEIQSSILGFAHKVEKPVVMLEVGWCSMENAVTEPWDYTQETVPLDLNVQKKLYEAYFESWYGKPGFGGFMIWAWTPNASGPEDRGYTPEGKPAEQVLRQWLTKGPWKVD
jgi:hypothetical protein